MRTTSEEKLTQAYMQREMAKYWGLVHQVDRSIGVIIAKLKELNLYENTIIVYTSEHGKMMGKFGHGGKSVMYDLSARVPLFLKIPGVPAAKIDYPVSQIDLMPTLLDAMGLEIPSRLPGKSLLPHLDRDHGGNVFLEWHPGKNIGGMVDRCPEGYSEEQCTLAALQRIRAVITPNG
jgi:arylsulfatase A-like enzyme